MGNPIINNIVTNIAPIKKPYANYGSNKSNSCSNINTYILNNNTPNNINLLDEKNQIVKKIEININPIIKPI